MAFYNQTLSAVTAGREKMQAAGLPIRRPNDYFCENVKSDAHMTKVGPSSYCGWYSLPTPCEMERRSYIRSLM
jgi:hypothetical protein